MNHSACAASAALIAAAQALAPQIQDAAAALERDRRLPWPLVNAMADAGFFRMLIPTQLGGSEVDVATMIRVIEAVSTVDGSAGWCVMAASSTAVISAYLQEDTAHAIYGSDPRVVTGGVFAPKGQALVVDGGYRVTGRWPFIGQRENAYRQQTPLECTGRRANAHCAGRSAVAGRAGFSVRDGGRCVGIGRGGETDHL